MCAKFRLFAVLASSIIILISHHPVRADPIMRIEGSISPAGDFPAFVLSVVGPDDTPGGEFLGFVPPPGATATKFDNNSVHFETSFGNIVINQTGTVATSSDPTLGATDYVIFHADPSLVTSNGVSKNIQNLPSSGPFPDNGDASFVFSNITALVPFQTSFGGGGKACIGAVLCNTLFIQGDEENVNNTSTDDFSALRFFQIKLVAADPNVNFIGIIENGELFNSRDSSGTFIESSSSDILIGLTEIPEPGSLSLILFGLGGLWFARGIRPLATLTKMGRSLLTPTRCCMRGWRTESR